MDQPDITPEAGTTPESAHERSLAVRDKSGRFVKGAPSPNPGGRPKADGDLVAMARAATPEAFAFVLATMNNPKARRSDRLKCAEILLERGHGKAPQSIALGDPEGKPLVPPNLCISFTDGGPGQFPTDARAATLVAGKPYQPAALPAPSAIHEESAPESDDVEVSGPAGESEELSPEHAAPHVPAPDSLPVTALNQEVPAPAAAPVEPAAAPATPRSGAAALLALMARGLQAPIEGELVPAAEPVEGRRFRDILSRMPD